MMVPFRRKKSNKQFPVKVCTFDSELEFHLEHRATGRYLFELICRTIGLRETWYFGLQFEDSKGNLSWLKMDKKVQDQSVHMTNGSCMFIFLAKFFPENVAEELVQEVTQHLFFLQIKQAILSMDVYCPPEASVLLASYAVQAKYGDYDEAVCKPGMLISENLLPQRVIDQYQMTPQMWEERIKTWYADHRGMSRDEAEMEYLKIAQDLDMFGVNYFPITNKKNTEVWLGVTALGLNIYNKENKLLPVTTFQWNEILHISFDDRKFVVKTNDSKSPKPVIFYSQKLRINKLILDLCVGNHDLYMKRRKPDTMEIQQMKAQAKEEKQRRQVERNKLTREKQLREAAEREKAAMEQRLMQLQEEMRAANEALHRSEEAAELLAEKNRLAEEEAMLLSHKAQEVEQEINRMRMTARKTEEEKMYLERKTQEAELLTARMMEESRKRALEADKLKNELIHARVAEKEAKEKLLNFLSRTSTESILITPSSSPESPMHEMHSYDLLADGDMEQLSLEIEKERVEYLAKSKQVQNQLKELRSEIEQLKIGENQCPLDDINAEQLRLGETKYSTLKKVKSGSTKARVAFFEELEPEESIV
ncbi:moesin/ezrin/radixin homolog 2 isoform X1 [Anopheles arabiensis]|uniref:Moesin/ezrin/radixin homolog 1 n=9 Tax=gambiae species complex TaxID=44542 RepID=A0A1S4H4J1_ANOGA|nr:moesin/ezrin/radixin homolog 2 isoform X1 [Anopheles arabiensis]XP_040232727.1 moesin/ezrin/radixin homolog 2 isoform X1 [Anopheles coluzzii]XP_041782657.1 moesin/ezrin/radixin homolog 2-like isoform X1 [Anopheles merus]XP_041787263.1 moesin/ezrin/radixin homolog 2-like isoform X1 [Anopheles merus]XP_061517854.1 moesin/ezrin/radixin homolog 2 isoform X1 [Anopheles gambiae]